MKIETELSTHAKTTPPKIKKRPAPKDSLSRITTIVKELPSRGLSYPTNCEVTYRPYTFGEIKRVTASKNMTVRQMFEEILAGVECSFDLSTLTLGDVLYIGLLRKISTLGTTKVVLHYQCGKCVKDGKHILDTNKLEFDDILAKFSDKDARLPICAEFSWGETEFNPLTMESYYKLLDYNKEFDVVAKLAMESSIDFDKAYKQFNGVVDNDDKRILDQVDNYLYHGLKAISFKCENTMDEGTVKCNNNISLELDGGQALILPFRQRKVDVHGRIRLGPKT